MNLYKEIIRIIIILAMFESILTFHNGKYPEWINNKGIGMGMGIEVSEIQNHFGVLEFTNQNKIQGLTEKYNNMEIEIFYGFIYDWKTNSWVNSLNIDSLDKLDEVYYITCMEPLKVKGYLFHLDNDYSKKIVLDEIQTLPDLMDEKGEPDITDHTTHMNRYRNHKRLF